MRLNPYLMFNGQCEAAFKFYENCLLATRALLERLDLIGKPAPGAPSVVDLRLFPRLGLHPEFVLSV